MYPPLELQERNAILLSLQPTGARPPRSTMIHCVKRHYSTTDLLSPRWKTTQKTFQTSYSASLRMVKSSGNPRESLGTCECGGGHGSGTLSHLFLQFSSPPSPGHAYACDRCIYRTCSSRWQIVRPQCLESEGVSCQI